MQDTMFAYTGFYIFSGFIFKVNHVFIENKNNLSEKVVIDSIGNFEVLPRIVFVKNAGILDLSLMEYSLLQIRNGNKLSNCCTLENLRCINSSVNEIF